MLQRVISATENISANQWQMPQVGERHTTPSQNQSEDASYQQLKAAAEQEGYAQGYAAGISAGQEAAQATISQLTQILASLQDPSRLLEEQVLKLLMEMMQELVKQCLADSVAQDPIILQKIIAEAVACLPLSDETVSVFLHPNDIEVVRGSLSDTYTLKPDPALYRGECRVASRELQINATVKARLQQVILASQNRDTTA